ncbi:MAG: FmdE family protein [Candidatus Promineifilaceae bacterium]
MDYLEAVDIGSVALAETLAPYLERSTLKHRHLCPRQILGVRMGLAGGAALGMDVPRQDKKMLVLVETDGCFISGVEASSGCSVNRRTMRVIDFGRIAATFVNVKTETAVRVAPKQNIRERAKLYAPEERRRYFAMLHGYQRMPIHELLTVEPVELTLSLKALISRPGVRVDCQQCGEEIINEREVFKDGQVICRACAGEAYYLRIS